MKINVNDCLKLDAFRGASVIACRENCDRRVRTISVLDEDDLDMGVQRNGVKEQMVITHFWTSKDDADAQAKAVKELGSKGISALVVYLNDRGVTSVAPKTIEAAESVGLPLITINDTGRVTYSMLIEEVLDKILYGENYSDNILNNTIYHLLNFDRHSNFPSALREAALHNNYQVVLMTEEFNTILTVETRHLVKIEDAVSAARKLDAFNMTGFTRVEIEEVITYWGFINIKDKKYILVIVDNEDDYSSSEMTKLAQTIELAIGMWKYTPDRDSRAEFIKSAVRGDVSFCHTLLDESGLRGMQFSSAFYIKNVGENENDFLNLLSAHRIKMDCGMLITSEAGEIYGIVYAEGGQERGIEIKNSCLKMFDEIKGLCKEEKIFHVTGTETLETCIDGFKMINKTAKYIEKIFPYKRMFSKYEISMVSDCVYMEEGSQSQRKMYLDLLEPCEREVSKNKGNMLIETLSTFVLDAGMNSGKTAKFMDIHNNTVQYRLKKANEILGAEMTGNRVIPGLTMALALKRLEDQ
ncbi:MAG: PucR family transcriptional regulator [Mogibacterium sp.]|nr:PucR family transcriptional regulator [Mogibacterium sp.]